MPSRSDKRLLELFLAARYCGHISGPAVAPYEAAKLHLQRRGLLPHSEPDIDELVRAFSKPRLPHWDIAEKMFGPNHFHVISDYAQKQEPSMVDFVLTENPRAEKVHIFLRKLHGEGKEGTVQVCAEHLGYGTDAPEILAEFLPDGSFRRVVSCDGQRLQSMGFKSKLCMSGYTIHESPARQR